MPRDQQHDFYLGTPPRGFMLARGRSKGRAWRRSSVASIPGAASPDENKYGSTAPQIAFREVFDDWSGGDGYAYRTTAPANGVHYSQDFDVRFPGQAIHCQALQLLGSSVPSAYNADAFLTVPISQGGIGPFRPGQAGTGDVLVVGPRVGHRITPKASASFDFFSLAEVKDFRNVPAIFGSAVFIGDATGTGFVANQLDAATACTVGSAPGMVFANAGPQLWRFQGDLSSTYAPVAFARNLAEPIAPFTEANWSATLGIGNRRASVQAALGYGAQVFAGAVDGLYASDSSGTFVNVSGPLGGAVHRDNWRDLCVHQGEVVGPHVSGLYAFNPTTTAASRLRSIGPVAQSSRSPVTGRFRCATSHGGWLLAGVWTGSASYLRAGREVAPGDWRWTTLNRLPHVASIHRLHVDGITAASSGTPVPERLWIATDPSINYGGLTGTAPVYVQPIPQQHGNPLAPSPAFSANYTGSALLVLPGIDRGAPGVVKVGEAVEVWADGFLSGSRYADVYYTADRGARTLLGRAQTSPVSTLLMGSTNGSFVTFRNLDLELESYDSTPGTCQVYRSVVLLGNLRPQYVETIDAVVTAADGAPDRRGTPMRSGASVLDDLRDLADPLRRGGQPHRLVDLAGATSYVVLDGMPQEAETYQEGAEYPELTAQIRLVVMTLTQNP